MLFFIVEPPTVIPKPALFKYISCYSLSGLERFQHPCRIHLNTSHVILYLNDLAGIGDTASFKYISCYSLSFPLAMHYLLHYNLNTSHVILYRFLNAHRDTNASYLNTSHVILYRGRRDAVCSGK